MNFETGFTQVIISSERCAPGYRVFFKVCIQNLHLHCCSFSASTIPKISKRHDLKQPTNYII
jgi:hypothetical protein